MIKSDFGWTKYILSKLDKSEVIEGNPTCAGLARVFEQEFGRIISKGVKIVSPPTSEDSHATLVCFINYIEYPIKKEDDERSYDPDGFSMGGIAFSVEAGVDTSMEMLPEPFNQHVVSSLDTRAYSRAIKQAMGLHCFTDEEMKSNDAHRNKISPVTVETILNRSKKLKIDVDKFLTINASCTSDELGNLSAEAGHDLLEIIKEYEDSNNIPKEIK